MAVKHWDYWTKIAIFDEYLDNTVDPVYKEHPLAQDWARIAKIGEELGEAVQAFIGTTGQNPRKGFTHTDDEVLGELADIVNTACLAIQHFTKNQDATREIVNSKLTYSLERIGLL